MSRKADNQSKNSDVSDVPNFDKDSEQVEPSHVLEASKSAFITYSTSISSIADLESKSMDRYHECRRMAKDGTLSDQDLAEVLSGEIVPTYSQFAAKLRVIATPSSEIVSLHRLYIYT